MLFSLTFIKPPWAMWSIITPPNVAHILMVPVCVSSPDLLTTLFCPFQILRFTKYSNPSSLTPLVTPPLLNTWSELMVLLCIPQTISPKLETSLFHGSLCLNPQHHTTHQGTFTLSFYLRGRLRVYLLCSSQLYSIQGYHQQYLIHS